MSEELKLKHIELDNRPEYMVRKPGWSKGKTKDFIRYQEKVAAARLFYLQKTLDEITEDDLIRELKKSVVVCSYFIARRHRVSIEQKLQFMKTQAFICNVILNREASESEIKEMEKVEK